MIDREKVIKAYEICDNNEDGIVCKNCPYKEDKWNGAWEDETGKTCFQTLHADVLALLKEKEPRVMTTDEVGTWVMIDRVDRAPIVVEVRDRFITWIISDEYYDLPECNLSSEFYGKTWRCWTTRPTDEQRKAVKWE